MTFTLRNPISENPHLRNEAAVVSNHLSLTSARRALLELQTVAEQQGYHCEAFIWDEEHDCVPPGPR
jgi:hypothetical protein